MTYIPQYDINSLPYALECTFHKQKRYDYQKEFRITVINDRREAIEDIFIPVEEKDFNVIELQKDHGLKCEIHVVPDFIEEKTVIADFKIKLSLEKEIPNETSI